MAPTLKTLILLVEDDKNLGFILSDFLELEDFEVVWCQDGQEGFTKFKTKVFDLCLLDIMLPLLDGFSLANEIRLINKDVPIVFLTAREMQEDKIKGFKIGADDYITKPFSTEELKLRIDAILRRTMDARHKEKKNTHFIGSYTFDYENQLLKSSDQETHLTKKEADVLQLLCQYKNEILKRDVALKLIWGEDNYFMGRSMDVYITKLRKLLRDDPTITISNIHRIGFKLEVEE